MPEIWEKVTSLLRRRSAEVTVVNGFQQCRLIEQSIIQPALEGVRRAKTHDHMKNKSEGEFMGFWLRGLESTSKLEQDKSSGQQSPKTRMYANLDPRELQFINLARNILWEPKTAKNTKTVWEVLLDGIFSLDSRQRIITTSPERVTPAMLWLLACQAQPNLAQIEAGIRYFGELGLVDEHAFRARILSDIAVLYTEAYKSHRNGVMLDPGTWWNSGAENIADLERISPSLRLVIKELLSVTGRIGSAEGRAAPAYAQLETTLLTKISDEVQREEVREALAVLRGGEGQIESKMKILLQAQKTFGETSPELLQVSEWLNWEGRRAAISLFTELIEEKTGVDGLSEMLSSFFTRDSQSFVGLVQALDANGAKTAWNKTEVQELVQQEPLLLPYLEMLFTGESQHFSRVMYAELRKNPNLVHTEILRDPANPDNVYARIAFRPSDTWARDNKTLSVLDVFTRLRHKTLATPVEYSVPLSSTEASLLATLSSERQVSLLIDAVESASHVAIWQHGFSSSPAAAQPAFRELFQARRMEGANFSTRSDEVSADGLNFMHREVGLAMATKGSQQTVLEEVVRGMKSSSVGAPQSGAMTDAALQIVDTLKMLGVVGRADQPLVVYLGHSMGGQESMLVPFALDCSADIQIVPITPVMNALNKHLLLLKGLGNVLTKTVYHRMARVLPRDVVDLVAGLGDAMGITDGILKLLLESSSEIVTEILQEITAIHKSEFAGNKSAIIGGIVGLLKATNLSDPSLLGLINHLHGNTFLHFLIGGRDVILDSQDMLEGLQPVFGDKVNYLENAPHYVQLTIAGMLELIQSYRDGFKLLEEARAKRQQARSDQPTVTGTAPALLAT